VFAERAALSPKTRPKPAEPAAPEWRGARQKGRFADSSSLDYGGRTAYQKKQFVSKGSTTSMHSIIEAVSGLRPHLRRLVIMLMDVLMVMLSIPLSLLLSNSALSFDPLSLFGIIGWMLIGLLSHVLFRYSGLYNMMWRFASTPDFYNIFRNCAALSLSLYGITLLVRSFTPVTGLNERQFIVFFFLTFTFISVPRLVYRYLRDGRAWGSRDGHFSAAGKRALFFGSLDEADVIISYARASLTAGMRILGIVTNDRAARLGTHIQGIPIVSDQTNAQLTLEEYVKDVESLDLVIFGHGAEKAFPDFPELVRVARQGGLAVEQFSGLSELRQGGKLVLEKVEMETILRRSTVSADRNRLALHMAGKKVLVTGGAGSIGRVLVRRALDLGAKEVLVADTSEFNIFRLQSSFAGQEASRRLTLRILDICDKRHFTTAVRQFQPDIIFHAAALKHVPLLEENWISAIKTNVFGTLNCVDVAVECEVPQFVLISSDKAADPTSVLGLTKRTAEQIANAMHFSLGNSAMGGRGKTNFIGVRFGNVFGSDGSVATVFRSQIDAGGPVTITDPTMTRYLMTIAEAADLVIMAAVVSESELEGGGHAIFMLEMGDPVSIMTVAETMIRLAGKKPHLDIPIVIIGKRPGEKLHEALSAPGEEILDIGVPSIFGLKTGAFTWQEVETALAALDRAAKKEDRVAALDIMRKLYRPVDGDTAVSQAAWHEGEIARPNGVAEGRDAGANGAGNDAASVRTPKARTPGESASEVVHLRGVKSGDRTRAPADGASPASGAESSQEKHRQGEEGSTYRVRAR
jgi:O-antigen biosynthesis protein WbqV